MASSSETTRYPPNIEWQLNVDRCSTAWSAVNVESLPIAIEHLQTFPGGIQSHAMFCVPLRIGREPGPLSPTLIRRSSSCRIAVIQTSPPSARRDAQCRIAFSTKRCNNRSGMRALRVLGCTSQWT